MCATFLKYHAACKAQGLDRKVLPYYGYLQPFCAWYGLIWMTMVTLFYGYAVFRTGGWDLETFFGSYTILGVDALLYVGWKIIKRTKAVNKHDVDLVWERPTIDAYEATFIDPPVGFWRGQYPAHLHKNVFHANLCTEMGQLIGIKRTKGGNDKRVGSISN